MTRPVWLLDVDGVINAVRLDAPDGFERADVDGFAILYRPQVVERIDAMAAEGLVEVRWLTTWREHARDLEAALGMRHKFAIEVEERGDTSWQKPYRTWWKSTIAERIWYEDTARPIVWTDDDLKWSRSNGDVVWLERVSAPLLTISPDETFGLTDYDLDQIGHFCCICLNEDAA
jgi:hypothetical protein